MAKDYSNEELIKIGRKVIEQRQRMQEKAKEVRRIKNVLYQMYTDGKLGDLKV